MTLPGAWTARLRIDPTAFLAPGAVVVGDVRLDARSSVWFNTVVRGDTAPISVGEASNLQDNSVVHVDDGQPAVIGARVTVGHRSIVHGCVIEDDCLIGMGSVVLSGARIGRGSLIGAASLVREGQEIPPGSLAVGAPARVVGPVSEAHREAIRNGSDHYAELAASYARRGFGQPHPARSSDRGRTARDGHPLTFLEWNQLIGVLEESPRWAAERVRAASPERVTQAPAPGRWSALEVLAHLLDGDREVFLPRLERFEREDSPGFEDVDMTGWDVSRGYADLAPGEVLESWARVRGDLVRRLTSLGPEQWDRFALHSRRGPYPLSEMVRGWVDHDLSHRRQMAEAIKGPA